MLTLGFLCCAMFSLKRQTVGSIDELGGEKVLLLSTDAEMAMWKMQVVCLGKNWMGVPSRATLHLCVFVYMVLVMEPRTLPILGKQSPSELHAQAKLTSLKPQTEACGGTCLKSCTQEAEAGRTQVQASLGYITRPLQNN